MTALDLALVRGVIVEDAVHDGRAARVGQQLALIADKAARRGVEDHARAPGARGLHLQHVALALGQFLYDRAGMLVIDIDDDFLNRLHRRAVIILLHDNAWP